MFGNRRAIQCVRSPWHVVLQIALALAGLETLEDSVLVVDDCDTQCVCVFVYRLEAPDGDG